MNEENWIFEYYRQIQDGTVTVGRWIRTIYEMIVQGLADGSFFFDQGKADKAIAWIESHCFHTEGPLAPGPFLLETWQKALMSCMFGIVDEKGNRQFREVLLLVARKNGKSIFASAVAKYELQVDGGFGCRVYNVAPKLDQAEIIYGNTWAMITLDPEYRAWQEMAEEARGRHATIHDNPEIPRKRMSDIYIAATNSTMKKIAFSAKKSDGFNPSLAICDEIAAWEGDKGLKQYEVMKSGMGARPEGILLSCTTSGYINDSIYDELVKRSTRFLMGDSKEKRLLPFLYMVDDPAKWNDMDELRKSNPNLGVSVTEEYLQEEIAVAEGSLSKKAEFLTKYCNIKQNSALAWLSTEAVDKAYSGTPLQLDDFRGCYCVGGIDLSRTTDLTAACVLIEKAGRLHVFCRFYLPAEKIDEAAIRDNLPYRIYVQRGLLFPSGDNFVDYHDCEAWFKQLVEEYEILPLQVGYDRYNAQYLTQEMAAYGFHMDDVFQGFNLSPVILELEGLLKDGRIDIGDNDLLKIHLLDSALKQNNESGKSKLVKLNKSVHIDGTAALLDAMTVRQKWYADIGEQLKNGVD